MAEAFFIMSLIFLCLMFFGIYMQARQERMDRDD